MNMFWGKGPKPGNVGDLIGPYLYEKDTGVKPGWEREKRPTLMTCGSIARFAKTGTIVWGSGTIRESDKVCPDADWRMVRGPKTGGKVLEAGGTCPEGMADPALFLPLVYPRKAKGGLIVGIVPHYVDLKHPSLDGKYVISPLTNNVEGFIRDICRCGAVMSSSLHGIIIAHAYGIPAVWVKFSEGVIGEGWKFRDYFEGMGIMDAEPVDLSEAEDLPLGWVMGPHVIQPPVRDDLEALWETRPWNT